MGAIIQALAYVLQKFVELAAWIGSLVRAVFVAGWDIMRDGACWVFGETMDIAISALNAFDFSALSSWAGAWAGLPANVIEVMAAIGVTTAFGIVATAIVIRMGLQLIPFVRLGS